jgi:hypothetical protein
MPNKATTIHQTKLEFRPIKSAFPFEHIEVKTGRTRRIRQCILHTIPRSIAT